MANLLADLLLVPLTVFVVAIAAVTAFKLITGRIVTRGLLNDRTERRVSAMRIQMLISTLTVVGAYVAAIGKSGDMTRFPPIDGQLLLLLGGSNALMIGRQGFQQLIGFLRRPQ